MGVAPARVLVCPVVSSRLGRLMAGVRESPSVRLRTEEERPLASEGDMLSGSRMCKIPLTASLWLSREIHVIVLSRYMSGRSIGGKEPLLFDSASLSMFPSVLIAATGMEMILPVEVVTYKVSCVAIMSTMSSNEVVMSGRVRGRSVCVCVCACVENDLIGYVVTNHKQAVHTD